MRKLTIASTTLLLALAAPASAQTSPDNDVRCFLLSNVFAKQASDEKARAMAASSMAYYLGRLDSRTNAAAIAAAIRRTGPTIDQKTAGAQMSACAARMAKTEQAIETAVKAGGVVK